MMTRISLTLAAALLVAVLAYQWWAWPPPTGVEVPIALNPEGGGGGEAMDPLVRLGTPEPREAYASVTERPLFRPQRKPPEAEPEAPPEVAPEPTPDVDLSAFDLSAVVITPAIVSAWVRDAKAQGLKRLRLGDELEGWAVKDILSDRLVLERQGERNELLLRDFSKPSPPVVPPPRAVRPPPVARHVPQRPTPGTPQRSINIPPPAEDSGSIPSEPVSEPVEEAEQTAHEPNP